MAGIYNIVMTLLQRIPSFDHQWASLVAQLEKNLPAMQKTWVQSLGWEDPLEKGKATLPQYSGLENFMDYVIHKVAKSQT